jgi:serine/threonine-protein kinase
MGADRDTLLGQTAIARGYLTQAQLDEAIEVQRKAREDLGLDQDLPAVLVAKKLLTPDQTQDLKNAVALQTGEARMVGGYEAVARLGQGGMGVVYKAKKLDTGELVALKILPPSLASDDMVARFARESKMTAKLAHENIVRCVEFGRDEKRKVWFCALELVEGEDLRTILKRRGTLGESESVEIARQVAQALQHAFFHGLIHRDIKPENIMLAADGTVKLLDLGLARQAGSEAMRYTQSGMFVGSPFYVSPEQGAGDSDVDIRSDIYSLGATMYHMVTGAPPFGGTTVQQILYKHVHERLRWPGDVNAELSDDLCRMIARMMSKDPADRYQTPKELLTDIHAIRDGTPVEIDEAVLRRSTIQASKTRRDVRERRRPKARPSGRSTHATSCTIAPQRGTGTRHVRVGDRSAATARPATSKRSGAGAATGTHRTAGRVRPGARSWTPYAIGAGALAAAAVGLALFVVGGPAFDRRVDEQRTPPRVAASGTSGSPSVGPEGATPEGGARTAAARRLAEIRAMVTPDLARYADIRRQLAEFRMYFAGTPEAGRAKELLSEIDAAYAARAERALELATEAARAGAARGELGGAVSAIESIAHRFGEGPWLRTTGRAKIAAALEALEERRSGRRPAASEPAPATTKPRSAPERSPNVGSPRTSASLLAGFDALVAKADYAAAVGLARDAAAKRENEAFAEALRAAARVGAIMRDRRGAIVEGARSLIGTAIAVKVKTGTLTGTVKEATDEKLVLTTSYMINREKKERDADIDWSSLSPAQANELAAKGGLDADASDLAVARVYAALRGGDAGAAAAALEAAGAHPLGAHLRRRVEEARARAAYAEAMSAARRLATMRKWKDAAAALDRALAAKPDDAAATALLAEVRTRLGPAPTITLALGSAGAPGAGRGATIELLYVRPGTFVMGGDADAQFDWEGVEKPKHEVAITRGFYLGKYEVTRGQFAAFVDATGRVTGAEQDGRCRGRRADGTWGDVAGASWRNPAVFTQDDDHPVTCVDYLDATEFCRWASQKTGRAVRLPTEAEWEYACRAGSQAKWCFGDAEASVAEYAWFSANAEYRTHPVGRKKPNAWGFCDMHGSVYEWVADWYDAGYYARSPRDDPSGPARGRYRLVRGGSFLEIAARARCAFRRHFNTRYRTTMIGFRVAISRGEGGR